MGGAPRGVLRSYRMYKEFRRGLTAEDWLDASYLVKTKQSLNKRNEDSECFLVHRLVFR